MGRQRVMQRLARWHIWLGWLVALPVLLWTITGLLMVVRPIEEVRGTTLIREAAENPLPHDANIAVDLTHSKKPVRSVTTRMEQGEVVTRITYMDGTGDRFRGDGSKMGPLTDVEARMIAAKRVVGGDKVRSAIYFAADRTPFDFRRKEPVWQVTTEDGTHIYIGSETAEVEAVRTPWWRAYDFMWGLHIMDPQTREDTHNPLLLICATLSVLGAVFGTILLFRRRKARVETTA